MLSHVNATNAREKEGEVNRVVARSLPQSSSVLVSLSPRRPGACCPRSDPLLPGEIWSNGFERRRHAALPSDAGGEERTTKPWETRCTKFGTRALAPENVSASKANWVFKENVLGNLRPKIGVPENTQHQFFVNGAICGLFLYVCLSVP